VAKKKTRKKTATRRAKSRVRKYTNPSRMPKNWIKADRVRVVTNNGKKVLEIWRKPKAKKKRNPPRPAKKKAATRRRC
jgi:hypothetical protein